MKKHDAPNRWCVLVSHLREGILEHTSRVSHFFRFGGPALSTEDDEVLIPKKIINHAFAIKAIDTILAGQDNTMLYIYIKFGRLQNA